MQEINDEGLEEKFCVFSFGMTESIKCSTDNGENCTPPLIGKRRSEAITAPSGLSSFPQINSVDLPSECNTSRMTSLGGKISTGRLGDRSIQNLPRI